MPFNITIPVTIKPLLEQYLAFRWLSRCWHLAQRQSYLEGTLVTAWPYYQLVCNPWKLVSHPAKRWRLSVHKAGQYIFYLDFVTTNECSRQITRPYYQLVCGALELVLPVYKVCPYSFWDCIVKDDYNGHYNFLRMIFWLNSAIVCTHIHTSMSVIV